MKVFIGSGEASLLERKVLIYSIRKNTQQDVDIYVFNGTHNAIELNDQPPFLAPLSLKAKYQNVTEFSLYRFLIPQICSFQGRAIYVDSDTIGLSDIAELFNAPMKGCDFLAKKDAYAGTDLWGLSVMLIDCEKSRFDLETVLREVQQEFYTLDEFMGMSGKFLARHPYQIGEIDSRWNEFDYWDQNTKLIHYTNLTTQPWKYPNHPYGELWFQYLREAIQTGCMTQRDIDLSIIRSYVRQDLMEGNSPRRHAPRSFFDRLKRKL